MLFLYNPPSNAQRKPVLPMSVLAVGAVMEGVEDYLIVDGNIDDDPTSTLDRLIAREPRKEPEAGGPVLGVTVMPGRQLGDAVERSRELKRRYPHLTVVWGGYFPTQHYDACLRSDYVDWVVRGHGELAFRALLQKLRAGEDPRDIAGLAYRSAGGTVVSNPLAPIPDPDTLPDFAYTKVDVPRYVRPTFMGTRTLPHHSSYGCPFLCNFCAVVNMVNGRWFAQSAERTAKVVDHLVETYGVNAVEMYDNNFFTHEARTKEFAERIERHGIGWWGEARIDTLLKYKPQTWEAMRRSGLKMVFLGAESGSDETLKRMDKGGTATVEKTAELAALMKSYDIAPEFSFVLGNPPDPEADVRTTLEFIKRLKRINPHCEIILYMYTPVPLSGELYEQAKASGFKFPETLEEWTDPTWFEFAHRRSSSMPWLQDKIRRQVGNFQRVLNAYYPTTTDIRLKGTWRWVLKGLSAWRYHLNIYDYPLELKALQKLVNYQRPDTSGF